MRFCQSLGLLALLTLSFSAGCSMTNPTVRGQGPENAGPIVGTAPGYGQFKDAAYLNRHGKHDFKAYSQFRDNNLGYEGGYYAGNDRYVTENNVPYTLNGAGGSAGAGGYGVCPDCQDGRACPQSGCRHCGRGCGCPNHYQTYQHQWPQNLVYPQQGVPSGIVQYPYYTLRGPTDFFMQ